MRTLRWYNLFHCSKWGFYCSLIWNYYATNEVEFDVLFWHSPMQKWFLTGSMVLLQNLWIKVGDEFRMKQVNSSPTLIVIEIANFWSLKFVFKWILVIFVSNLSLQYEFLVKFILIWKEDKLNQSSIKIKLEMIMAWKHLDAWFERLSTWII